MATKAPVYNTDFEDLLPQEQVAIMIDLAYLRDNPLQFRRVRDDEQFRDLKASIQECGLLEPIIVRRQGDFYEVVAGARRTAAVRELGGQSIPAVVRAMTDNEAALIMAAENMQRADLSYADEAVMYERLASALGAGGPPLSDRALAEALHVNNQRISRLRRIAAQPRIMADLQDGLLTFTAAYTRASGLQKSPIEEILETRLAMGESIFMDEDGNAINFSNVSPAWLKLHAAEIDANRSVVPTITPPAVQTHDADERPIFSPQAVATHTKKVAGASVGWQMLVAAFGRIDKLWDADDLDPEGFSAPQRKDLVERLDTAVLNLGIVRGILTGANDEN